MEDSRLLDAAETLVTLQSSDLGNSNNPLFGSNIAILPNTDSFGSDEDVKPFQVLTDLGVQGANSYGAQGGSGGIGAVGRGRGAPRGARGGSSSSSGTAKRGRGKKTVGAGDPGLSSSTTGGGPAAPLSEGESATGGGADAAADGLIGEAPKPPAEMMRIGPLFVSASVIDDVLNEKKREIMEDPEVVEFLKRRRT